jgi:hypothetical protein
MRRRVSDLRGASLSSPSQQPAPGESAEERAQQRLDPLLAAADDLAMEIAYDQCGDQTARLVGIAQLAALIISAPIRSTGVVRI